MYNDHKGSHIRLPDMNTVDEVRILAECCADSRQNAFYRVFKKLPHTDAYHKRFVVAFSVLGGKVTEYHEVTIPDAHRRRDRNA